MNIFVTGCCGYIGSHTCVELLNAGYNVIGLDNFSNSKKDVLEKIEKITTKKIKFYEGNMLDKEILSKIFHENKIDCVIDFAAYKAVGESVAKPVEYYINNVSSVLTLLSVMKENNCKRLVFSSSATVYGDPEVVPITEDAKTGGTTNPYGTSKLFVEQILKDLYNSDKEWDICILRYFNPIGAHESGLIGEDPKGIPANLMPYISKVASGKLECLSIFGDDYDTKDGTGVRDYIHVVDLAIGHIKAVEKLEKEKQGLYIYNLGTGEGYSVLEMVHAFEKANNLKVPYKIVERRSGDIAMCYSSPKKAKEELGFSCKKTLDDMVRDAYHYEQVNKDL
jgi:UDP-glucose 4-epimerase